MRMRIDSRASEISFVFANFYRLFAYFCDIMFNIGHWHFGIKVYKYSVVQRRTEKHTKCGGKADAF